MQFESGKESLIVLSRAMLVGNVSEYFGCPLDANFSMFDVVDSNSAAFSWEVLKIMFAIGRGPGFSPVASSDTELRAISPHRAGLS